MQDVTLVLFLEQLLKLVLGLKLDLVDQRGDVVQSEPVLDAEGEALGSYV